MDWVAPLAAFLGAFAGVLASLLILARLFKQPDIRAITPEMLDRVEEAKIKYGIPDDATPPDEEYEELNIYPDEGE